VKVSNIQSFRVFFRLSTLQSTQKLFQSNETLNFHCNFASRVSTWKREAHCWLTVLKNQFQFLAEVWSRMVFTCKSFVYIVSRSLYRFFDSHHQSSCVSVTQRGETRLASKHHNMILVIDLPSSSTKKNTKKSFTSRSRFVSIDFCFLLLSTSLPSFPRLPAFGFFSINRNRSGKQIESESAREDAEKNSIHSQLMIWDFQALIYAREPFSLARFGNDRFESRINEIFKHFNEGVMRKYVRQASIDRARFPSLRALNYQTAQLW
jgi:hypothetical protein